LGRPSGRGRDEQFRFGMSPDEIGANNPHQSLRALYLEPFTLAWADHRKRTPSADGSAEAVITKE
jgi:hypothetical protein